MTSECGDDKERLFSDISSGLFYGLEVQFLCSDEDNLYRAKR